MNEPSPFRKVRTAFWLGDTVYLRVRDERVRGMVTTVPLFSGGQSYDVTWGDTVSEVTHQEMELTAEFVPDFGAPQEDAS